MAGGPRASEEPETSASSAEPPNTSANWRSRFLADHGWPTLLLLSLVIVFFWPVLFGGKTLLPLDNLFQFPPFDLYASQYGITSAHNELISDALLQNLPWRTLFRDALSQGQLPLWNPYILSGIPFMAAGQQAVLYPFGLIFYLVPLVQAYGLFTALHFFLGGLFMYAFLRSLEAGRLGATVGAIVCTFSGVMVVSVVWPMVVSTLIWLP